MMSNMFDMDVITENIILDKDGKPSKKIVTVQKTETVNGTRVHRTTNHTVALGDGLQYHPAMSSAKSPNPIYVTTCAICTDPAFSKKTTDGLISHGSSRRCNRCGKTICSIHSRTLDGDTYCIKPCAKIYKFKKLLKAIFFKEED